MLWRQWVRNLPLDPILERYDIPYSHAVRLLASYLKERCREIEKLGANATAEKIIGAYEDMESILWQHIQYYQTKWAEALQKGDEKEASRFAYLVRSEMELLSVVTTRKAEMMRRMGVLPSTVERSAHLVGIVQSPSLNDFSAIIPRLPVKAPTALPDASDIKEDKTLMDASFELLADKEVEG